MKRSLAAFLAVFLILTMCLPVFASDTLNEQPLVSDSGSSSTMPERESTTPSESVIPSQQQPASDTENIPAEDSDRNVDMSDIATQPDSEKDVRPELDKITAQVEHVATGWRLSVELPYSVRVGTKTISPEYSLDGSVFLPVTDDDDGTPVIWDEIEDFNRQSIGAALQPMKGFVGKTYHKFYFRMNIEGDNYNGYSDVYLIERILEPQPMPENMEILASLPSSSVVKISYPPSQRGLFHVTVREGTSRDTLLSYLPTALPVRWILQPLPGTLQATVETDGTMYGVNWNLPQGLSQGGIFKECIELVPTTNEKIFHGMLANYNIPRLPLVQVSEPVDPSDPGGPWIYKDMPFDLAINVIPADEKISPQFGMTSWNGFNEEILAFSLPNKPSGATRIVAEYSLDGGKSWKTVPRADGNNLIELGYKPDRVSKQKNYAAPLFFDNDQTPMKEYLADNSKTFLIRLNINGGVYDGISQAFSWPETYNFDPPIFIDTSSDGGDGNRGDVGSGDNGNGGERPGIPNPTPDPMPNPTPDPVPEPTPEPVPESTTDSTLDPAPDHTSNSKPEFRPILVLDTKPESTLPLPKRESPAKPSKVMKALLVTPKTADVSIPLSPDYKIPSTETQQPNMEEPSAPPEAPASVESTETKEQTIQPAREPDEERRVSSLAVTIIALAVIAVAGGTIAMVGGVGTFSSITTKVSSLIRKLINIFTHP